MRHRVAEVVDVVAIEQGQGVRVLGAAPLVLLARDEVSQRVDGVLEAPEAELRLEELHGDGQRVQLWDLGLLQRDAGVFIALQALSEEVGQLQERREALQRLRQALDVSLAEVRIGISNKSPHPRRWAGLVPTAPPRTPPSRT